jgi:uncharacterized membrane protein YecN with MAPEG domain
MTSSNDFRREQREVAIRMAAALCVTILVSAASLRWGAASPRPLIERLNVAVTADLFVLCWLAATIGNVARLRFFSVDDIAGSGSGTATDVVSRANAVLRNTLEQVTLAIPVHVALATLVTSSAPLIVALAALFGVGRLLFWIGYANGARARAFGFALTFYPSVCGLIIALAAAIRRSL